MKIKPIKPKAINRNPSKKQKDKVVLVLTALCLILFLLFMYIPINSLFMKLDDHWRYFMTACIPFLVLYFGYSHVMYSLSKEPILARLKIYFSQIVVASTLIGIYVVILKYSSFNIQFRPTGPGSGFSSIVMVPLLCLSILILDFCFKRGILYDSIKEYLSKRNIG
jgi:predicted permease